MEEGRKWQRDELRERDRSVRGFIKVNSRSGEMERRMEQDEGVKRENGKRGKGEKEKRKGMNVKV
jgi:hypothetical protein